MATIISIVTKPCLVIKYSCIYGLGSIWIVINTLVELLSAAICFHVYMFWRTVIWGVALITLPARALTALQRERLLQVHLNEVQDELESLVWERKGLQERLQIAIKERAMMELMLAELEEEHDQAITKIEVVEIELQDLKDENCRLKEVQGKSRWSSSGRVDTGYGQNLEDGKSDIPCGWLSWGSNKNDSGVILQDLLMHKDAWGDSSRDKTEAHDVLKTDSGPIHQFMPGILSRNLYVDEVLGQRRDIALSRSLFSAVLSLLVGVIIWEAEDPCMPLVLALFTVVGMSLTSVVQFFSTIKNKPASDAVALLSFNWFILGTLTYPTLPRVARMLAPFSLSFVERILGWLGFSSLIS